ncbi:Helix-turn-helix domain-containing protein [Dyadobacter sp. SG02]|uniref:helix-turn-helix domain-containing protein n=1 Tax=Dyadobacter sp. SG02 TaxID=1855291 RepID=UPI0008C848FD|nr:helix-turn-helix transcriptional regulator [Dyadobacter sp. SG02]SEJ83526.1 Helix-turn-helix domain-containing protein [Dyadobacter sp. SG02]
MHPVQTIVDQVKILRQAAGISQKEMAGKINLDVTNYRKLEAGKRKRLDLHQLLVIADALKTAPEQTLVPITQNRDWSAQPGIALTESMDFINDEYHYQEVITLLRSIIEKQHNIIAELNKLSNNSQGYKT